MAGLLVRYLATRRMGELGGHTIMVYDRGGPTVEADLWGVRVKLTRDLIEREFEILCTVDPMVDPMEVVS